MDELDLCGSVTLTVVGTRTCRNQSQTGTPGCIRGDDDGLLKELYGAVRYVLLEREGDR